MTDDRFVRQITALHHSRSAELVTPPRRWLYFRKSPSNYRVRLLISAAIAECRGRYLLLPLAWRC